MLEVRFLKNLENKILLRGHTGRKVKVDGRSGRRIWKRRHKQFNAYMPEEGCQKGRCDTFFTHSHRKRQRKVINLGSVKCRTLCTSVAETSDQLWGMCVTKPTRSLRLLFTNKMRAR